MEKIKAFICDLEGTLSNSKHRHGLAEAGNWAGYYEELKNDSPNTEIITIANSLVAGGYVMILITGRPKSVERDTIEYMNKYGVRWGKLFSRPDGNIQPNSNFKIDVYKKLIEPEYEILLVIDDMESVTDDFYKLGITSLLVSGGVKKSNELSFLSADNRVQQLEVSANMLAQQRDEEHKLRIETENKLFTVSSELKKYQTKKVIKKPKAPKKKISKGIHKRTLYNKGHK